jgi:hypothetical protein
MKAGETRMLDWRGVEVKVGDIVVYPVRHSSSMWMVEGEVTALHSMIEDRWKSRDEGMVPTQVGGVTLKRLRESLSMNQKEVPPKLVKVGLDRLTVVKTAEEMEFERHPIRYSTGLELDEDAAVDALSRRQDQVLTIDLPNIEIDGRAS